MQLSEDIVATAAELARAHPADVLGYALFVRLQADGRGDLEGILRLCWGKESGGPYVGSGLFATALVARLRLDRRAQVADAILTALRGASVNADPAHRLEEAREALALRSEISKQLRAEGRDEMARRVERSGSIVLRSILLARLRADGRGDLAERVETAWRASEQATETEGHAGRRDGRAPPGAVVQGEALAHDFSAPVLARATITALCREGRDALAGSIIVLWQNDVAGPSVSAGVVLGMLAAKLRAEALGGLAEAMETALQGESLDRDPVALQERWLAEAAGPIVEVGPLVAALGAALSKEGHGGIAGAIRDAVALHALR